MMGGFLRGWQALDTRGEDSPRSGAASAVFAFEDIFSSAPEGFE